MMLRLILFSYLIFQISIISYAQKNSIQKAFFHSSTYDTCYHSGVSENVSILSKNPRIEQYRKLYEQDLTSARLLQEKYATAEIIINFSPAFNEYPRAKDAFRYAADLWELEIVSAVPIIINANITEMAAGVIGSNSSSLVTNVPNAPDPSIVYLSSLGNAIAGYDLLPEQPDMTQTYNSNFNFYYGTDGNPPDDLTDFVSIAFHEIGHGMGITGQSAGGQGVGLNFGYNPYIWDTFVELEDGTPILDLGYGTEEQIQALISEGLYINSYHTNKALNGGRAKIYAPFMFNSGSSFSHWDETEYPAGDPNSLMTPQIGNGEAIHDLGAITRGILRDLGWELSSDEDYDIGVTAIVSPQTGLNLSDEVVQVQITNFGIKPVGRIPVTYQVNNGAWVSEIMESSIAPNQTMTYSFTTLADLSADGESYIITARTNHALDSKLKNNSSSTEIFHQKAITEYPYSESFENGTEGWTVNGGSWELGQPAGVQLTSAPDGTAIFATNLAGNYLDDQHSSLITPVFDFTNKADPVVEFNIWYDIESGWDGLTFQMQVIGTDEWVTIGKYNDGNNWFNDGAAKPAAVDGSEGDSGIDALLAAGEIGDGWTGISGIIEPEWQTASHVINGASGKKVIFRFLFASDLYENEEGAAIDNFIIFADELKNDDIGITAIHNPTSGNQSEAENLTVSITNFGVSDAQGFEVGYQVNEQSLVKEVFSEVLSAGQTREFTFTDPLNLSEPGEYSIEVMTLYNDDENASNNSFTLQIESNYIVADYPYKESFENGFNNWTTDSEAWVRIAPAGGVIDHAADGEYVIATNAEPDYEPGQISIISSPVFDISEVQDPVLVFNIWYETEFSQDGVIVQYTSDDVNWITLTSDSSINGTNSKIASLPNYGDVSGWSGSSEGYRLAYIPLNQISSETFIKFRFVFGSDEQTEAAGVAIDDIRLFSSESLEFTVDCQDNIDLNNDPGEASAYASLENPVVSGIENFEIHNDFNYFGLAEGDFKIGETVINYLIETEHEVQTCNIVVTVLDAEAPEITCPDDITIATPPGETQVKFTYGAPVVIENYGFSNTITYSTNQNVDGQSGIACPTGPNSYWRVFNLTDDFNVKNDFDVLNVDVGIQSAEAGTVGSGISIPATVNIYTLDPDNYNLDEGFETSSLTLLSTENFDIPVGTENKLIKVPVNAVIPVGQLAVLEFTTEAGNQVFPGANAGQSGESFISAVNCSIDDPTNVRAIDFPDAQWVMNLNGISNANPEPVLVSGIKSGQTFSLGESQQTFEISDVAENKSTCSFIVEVIEGTLPSPVLKDPDMITSSSLSFTWDEVEGVSSYQIFASDDNFTSNLPEVDGVIINSNSFVLTNLEQGTPYQVKIRSVDGAELNALSAFSNVITASTIIPAPDQPEVEVFTSEEVVVRWNRITNISDYEVLLLNDGLEPVNGYPVKIQGLETVLGGLSAGTDYFVQVRAVNAGGESEYSEVTGFTTLLATPRALSATGIETESLIAHWNEVEGAVEYKVEYIFGNFNIESPNYKTTTTTSTEVILENLNPHTTYQYRVTAIDEEGVPSEFSNVIRATTLSDIPVALEAENISSYSARLFWNNTKNVNTYELDISDDSFETFLDEYESTVVNDTTILITGLNSSTTYQARVRSINRSGRISDHSNTIVFSTTDNTDAPEVPKVLAASDITTSGFTANWSDSENALFYEVEVLEDEGGNLLFTEIAFDNSNTMQDLEDDVYYRYRVRAYNDIAYSDWSEYESVVTILNIMGNSEIFTYYPNPVSDKLFIKLNQLDNAEVIIYNSLMQQVYKSGLHNGINNAVDFSGLDSGLYFVNVQTEQKLHSFKIVKK